MGHAWLPSKTSSGKQGFIRRGPGQRKTQIFLYTKFKINFSAKFIYYQLTGITMAKKEVPEWFYYSSVLIAFLFTMYISVYATIHFEDIKYMNLVVVFFFLAITMFFLISTVYFKTEKMCYHAAAPALFLAG